MSNYLELLREFIKTDFKLRYKNSYLGIIWIVLKPLALFAVIYVIFSNILQMPEDYMMSLLLGIMFITFFSEGIMMGLGALMAKSGIILKIKFPREIVVISAVTISFIDFLLNLIIFAVFTIFSPVVITPLSFLLFVIALLSLYLLILGSSLFLSIMFIKLRDIHNLMQVLLQLFFWATPVYYQLSMLPEDMQRIVLFNPLTRILGAVRMGLITGGDVVLQDFVNLFPIVIFCVLFLALGILFFRKRVIKIAEHF
jgi:ABC-type polysaccharide/polyol phosphate export permease